MQNTNPKTTRLAKKDDEAIKLPILAPLFVAIAVLLAIFTLAIYRLQQQNITDDVRMRLDGNNRYFNQLLFADAQLIGETTHFVKDNPRIFKTPGSQVTMTNCLAIPLPCLKSSAAITE